MPPSMPLPYIGLANRLLVVQILFKKILGFMGFETSDVAALTEIGNKFNALTMEPRDVAFIMFNTREQTVAAETSIKDIAEELLAAVLRFLSF